MRLCPDRGFETPAYHVGTGDRRTPFGSRREARAPVQLGTGDTTLY